MSKIPEQVLFDEEDRQRLEDMGKWYIDKKGYCRRTDNKNKKAILMHRFIIECPADMQVDHVNHNKLDNRKCNLRIVTNQQNQWNKNNIKGCHFNKQRKKWTAQITTNNKKIYLGIFNTEQEASEAYLKAKLELQRI